MDEQGELKFNRKKVVEAISGSLHINDETGKYEIAIENISSTMTRVREARAESLFFKPMPIEIELDFKPLDFNPWLYSMGIVEPKHRNLGYLLHSLTEDFEGTYREVMQEIHEKRVSSIAWAVAWRNRLPSYNAPIEWI